MIRSLILWTRGCKWRGSTLPATSMVETVVSMTILLTILTLSFAAIDRINKSLNPEAQFKAHLVTCAVLCRDDLLIEEIDEYEVEGYLVKKKIKALANDVYLVELTVLSGHGFTIYTRKIIKSSEIEL